MKYEKIIILFSLVFCFFLVSNSSVFADESKTINSENDWENNELTSEGTHTFEGDLTLGDWFDSHEDGVIDPWVSQFNLIIDTTRVYYGSYSIGSDQNVEDHAEIGYVKPVEISGGERIGGLEVYWKELDTSTGGGVRLKDNSGNWVFGFGTWNPQWFVDDSGNGDFYEVYAGDGYDRWIYFRFIFDWEESQYDYYMEDLSSGHIESGTRSLTGSTQDVDTIKIEYIPNSNGWRQSLDNPMVMSFDDWKILNELGTWTSTEWPSGAEIDQRIKSIEYEAAVIDTSENIWWNVTATDTGENTGYFQDPNNDNLITQSELESEAKNITGKDFQVSIKLESNNKKHSPLVNTYTLNTEDTGAEEVTVDKWNIEFEQENDLFSIFQLVIAFTCVLVVGLRAQDEWVNLVMGLGTATSGISLQNVAFSPWVNLILIVLGIFSIYSSSGKLIQYGKEKI